MFLSKHQTLEDRVVQALLGGPQTLKALSKYFETEGYAPSLRAIYKAVTALIAADVAVKAGKVVRINQEWLRTARARLAVSPVPALASGEKMALSLS